MAERKIKWVKTKTLDIISMKPKGKDNPVINFYPDGDVIVSGFKVKCKLGKKKSFAGTTVILCKTDVSTSRKMPS